MDLIRGADELRSVTDATRAAGRDVRLVPTMGALHGGHVSLIRLALDERALDDRPTVVVSIFVPSSSAILPTSIATRVTRPVTSPSARARGRRRMGAPGRRGLSAHWCCHTGPGAGGIHVRGRVSTGPLRGRAHRRPPLLDVTGPCAAFFGEKDASGSSSCAA